MTGCRRLLAVLMMMFLAIPLLVAITLAVGAMQGLAGGAYLEKMPRAVLNQVPLLLEDGVSLLRLQGRIDDDARVWLDAIEKHPQPLLDLYRKTGMQAWLEGEVVNSLERLSRMMRGEEDWMPLHMDLRPMKRVMTGPEVHQYLRQLLDLLPPCTPEQEALWELALARPGLHLDQMPPCRPADPDEVMAVLDRRLQDEAERMDDTVPLMNSCSCNDMEDFSRFWAHFWDIQYLLFLIPGIFLALAALIADHRPAGFLRWLGGGTLVGGGVTFLMAKAIGHAGLFTWSLPMSFYEDTRLPVVFSHRVEEVVLQAMRIVAEPFADVAAVVCIAGVVLIGLSYLVPSRRPLPGNRAEGTP